jgi:Na+/melibiose symporter-like transporter
MPDTLVGLVLLLFALGQAFDTPLLAWALDAVTSEVGRWLVVALIAVALIAFATDAPWESWG